MESPISIQDHEVESLLVGGSLVSLERMDRPSPELWPEPVPGINDFPTRPSNRQPEWMSDFNRDDIKLLAGLSTMTANALVAEVKKLYDAAYALGCIESRETSRGKLLQVLSKPEKKGSGNGSG